MQIRIIYDDDTYNTGIIYIGKEKFEYNYDTDIKEFMSNIFQELGLDFETQAFNFEELDEHSNQTL